MSNGEVCCILGVCCPPAQRKKALIEALVHDGADGGDAEWVTDWFLDRFDFAPKGTLDPLVQAIADSARKHPRKD